MSLNKCAFHYLTAISENLKDVLYLLLYLYTECHREATIEDVSQSYFICGILLLGIILNGWYACCKVYRS